MCRNPQWSAWSWLHHFSQNSYHFPQQSGALSFPQPSFPAGHAQVLTRGSSCQELARGQVSASHFPNANPEGDSRKAPAKDFTCCYVQLAERHQSTDWAHGHGEAANP